MNANVKIEEIAPLGDFVLQSYNRDFDTIKSKFSKMNEEFRDGFVAKLEFVKKLESTLLLNERRKGITASLYDLAKQLNGELNFLSSYFKDAGFNPRIVSELKVSLTDGNIEGAILQLEGLKQFVAANSEILVAQGMAPDYDTVLAGYKDKLITKNNAQNELINARKKLTKDNKADYDALLKMIKQIMSKGKIVFNGTVYQDEYTTSKVLQRMRAGKKKTDGNDTTPTS